MRRVVMASLFVIACGDGGKGMDPPADAPPISGDMYRLSYGPITVQPGQEGTKCIWLKLSNATEIKVHQVHDQLSASSHHLIVYRDDMDMTEQTTPVDCEPFTGALNSSGMIAPVVITQRADDLLTLPDRVAYTLKPSQMVKIEMHYLNATDAAVEASATVDFYASDPKDIDHEANILFIGTPDIDLAAGATQTVHQFFTVPSYVDFSASNIFAITGHTHKLGTDVQVRVAPATTGPMTSVYAPKPFSWSEPETTTHRPPFSIPKAGGFDFQCSYTNTTSQTVQFGESASDEMCFFWAYYYPSQGSKVCIHTDQYGGANGINLCCPGDNLCQYVEQMF